MRRMLKLLLLICCAVLSFVSMAHAGWTGPTEVVSTTFGSAAGQVGYVSDQYSGEFPRSFGVSSSGKIIVADIINERLMVYSAGGQFLNSISKPDQMEGWADEVLVNGECAVVSYIEVTHTFDLNTGILIGNVPNMGGADEISTDCSKIYVWTEKNGKDIWRIYAPVGMVLEEVADEPLELGRVKKTYMGNGIYQSKVTYPDKEWTFTGEAPPGNFRRDLAGHLFANLGNQVERIDDQGAVIASVSTPVTVTVEIPSGAPGIENSYEYPEMYGDAYIAPNGDVYCWKKTPTTYSILKWTWQETAQ